MSSPRPAEHAGVDPAHGGLAGGRVGPGGDGAGPAPARIRPPRRDPALAFDLVLGLGLLLLGGGRVPGAELTAWAAAFGALWLIRLGRSRPTGRQAGPGRRTTALATAACWGAAAWLWVPAGGPAAQAGLAVAVAGGGVAAALGAGGRGGWAHLALAAALLPWMLRQVLDGGPPGWWLAALVGGVALVGLGTLAGLGLARPAAPAAARHPAEDRARTRRREILRRHQAEAERVRHAAEAALRAQSRFLAAASHDLRQPLHALGLQAETLRRRTEGVAELASLVGSIHQSVEALEALFTALLDLGRLDSETDGADPACIPCQRLFDALDLAFRASARQKGLRLSFRGGGHCVQADPLRLERILRNLVANAIRHSLRGRILVCARRRGDRILLQVWDQGVGIPAADHARIFEEFCQLPGGPPPALHERPGLGLGLAIVQRLADRLGTSVSLRSRPGRGSVFGLSLAAGDGRAAEPAPAPPAPPRGHSLAGRRLLVVEDDAAARVSLVNLLQGWGATVEAHASLAALDAALRARPADAPPPELAMLDLHLADGSGLDALDRLRQACSAELPGLLLTGDAGLEPSGPAARPGLRTLRKPVAPARLRAMLQHLLPDPG